MSGKKRDKAKDAIDSIERQRMYDAGATDKEIAAAVGRDTSYVIKWRTAHKLTPNGRGRKVTEEQEAERLRLFHTGLPLEEIAIRLGMVSGSNISRWIARRGLNRSYTRRRENFYPIRPVDRDALLHRIMAALPKYLDSYNRDDAASEIYIGVLAGAIDEQDIPAKAKRIGLQVFDTYASKFGVRSLDADMGNSEGFRLFDVIPDQRASAWLEEMGATVY